MALVLDFRTIAVSPVTEAIGAFRLTVASIWREHLHCERSNTLLDSELDLDRLEREDGNPESHRKLECSCRRVANPSTPPDRR